MHDAVRGAPAGTVAGRMRFTEQGEIINEKYGLRGIAMRTLEQSAASVAAASLLPAANETVHPTWSQMMSTVANVSRDRYQSLTRHTEGFFEYFRTATPIDVIERMRIGSRPASRREQKGIDDLRAIPWVFAWTQARFVLPGWFGLGSGLQAAVEQFGHDAFADMMRDWHFVRALMADAEMVLAKSDLEVAERYSHLSGDLHERFFPIIKNEFDLTLHYILELSNNNWLLDGDKTLQRTILLRNPYIDPMSLLQIDLLRRWRAGDREDAALLGALLAGVNGIAQGLQNTG